MLLEMWYGTAQFILIFALTGGVGNLLSVMIRHAISADPLTHSGGGSVAIMGFVGLCAVVGLRSHSSRERELLWPMLYTLGITALLGVVFWGYIDNWGHACGVLVGLILGLADRAFLRNISRPPALTARLVGTIVILASGLAQVAADRREAPERREGRERIELLERLRYDTINRSLRIVSLLGERRVDPRVVIQVLQIPENRVLLGSGVTGPSYHRALAIAQTALVRRLTDEEQAEFDQALGRLTSQILATWKGLLRRKSTEADFDALQALAAVAATRKLTDEENDKIKARLAPLKTLVRKELEQRVRRHWREPWSGGRS
jgi:hypothetical protein